MPFYVVACTVNGVIRADGAPKYSMATTLTGAIINIVLDPIFIFVLNMGIKGAAWATIIGQIMSFIISFIYFFRTKTFKLKKSSFGIDLHVFSNVLRLGISTIITQMSIVVISLVCNIMLSKYGMLSEYGADIPIAALGICMKVFGIVINIVIGIVIGAQPIIGYNYGAKKYGRVRKTFKLVFISSLVSTLVATVVFEVFPKFVVSLFGSSEELYMEFAIKTFNCAFNCF